MLKKLLIMLKNMLNNDKVYILENDDKYSGNYRVVRAT